LPATYSGEGTREYREWLTTNLPDRASKVMSLIRQMRQGKENDSTFGRRFTGTGPYAWSIGRRFETYTAIAMMTAATPATL
jgi:DNA repair photolyase